MKCGLQNFVKGVSDVYLSSFLIVSVVKLKKYFLSLGGISIIINGMKVGWYYSYLQRQNNNTKQIKTKQHRNKNKIRFMLNSLMWSFLNLEIKLWMRMLNIFCSNLENLRCVTCSIFKFFFKIKFSFKGNILQKIIVYYMYLKHVEELQYKSS